MIKLVWQNSIQDIDFCRTCPGISVDLGQGYKANIAAALSGKRHFFFSSITGKGSRGDSFSPGDPVFADIDAVIGHCAVYISILTGQRY